MWLCSMHLVELKYKKAPRKDIESITVIQEEYLHTHLDRKDCTNALLWTKTTLITGGVGGAGQGLILPLEKRIHFSWVLGSKCANL